MTTFVWKVTFVSSLNKVVKKRRFQIPDWVKTEKKLKNRKKRNLYLIKIGLSKNQIVKGQLLNQKNCKNGCPKF
jgi:hypothetical protein